jgi:hypothetical protein
MPKLRHVAPCCNMRQRGRVATGTARLQQTAATGSCDRQRVQLAPPSAASVRGRSATMAGAACTERAPHRCPECAADGAAWPGRAHAVWHPTRLSVALDPGVLSGTVLCESARSPSGLRRKMRAAFGEAAARWRSEASAARPIPRAIAEPSLALASVSAAACQAALLSTAAGRRSGGSPGSHVVQTATAYCTTRFAACSQFRLPTARLGSADPSTSLGGG